MSDSKVTESAAHQAAILTAWAATACILTLINRFAGWVVHVPAFGTVTGHLLSVVYLAALLFTLLQMARTAARLPLSAPFLLMAGLALAAPMGTVLLLGRSGEVPPLWLSLTANNLFLPAAAALAGAAVGRVIRHPNTLLAAAGFAIFFDIIVVTMGTVAQLMKSNSNIIAAVSVGAGAPVVPTAGFHTQLPGPVSTVTIGPADVLFLAVFLSSVYLLSLSGRATFSWMYGLLLTALAVVEVFGIPVPALAPMGIAVLIANLRYAAFTPREKRDLVIGAAFAIACAGLIIFTSRRFLQPAPALPKLGFFLGRSAPNGPLFVRDVVPASPAEKSGLLPGDVLVAINGAPAAGLDRERFEKERQKAADSAGMRLTVRRPGEDKLRDLVLKTPPRS